MSARKDHPLDPSVELRRDARERADASSAMLRKLMTALVGATRAALRDERQRPVLRAAIAKLRVEVERHLEHEQLVLCPLLREAGDSARHGADEIAAVHSLERAHLELLARRAGDPARSVVELADEIARFVRRFERRISDEHALLVDAFGAPPSR